MIIRRYHLRWKYTDSCRNDIQFDTKFILKTKYLSTFMENKILFSVIYSKDKIDAYCIQRWEEK
jgi:hypothetical protein